MTTHADEQHALDADFRHHQRWYWSSFAALALITLACLLIVDLPGGRGYVPGYLLPGIVLFFLAKNAMMASWLRSLRGPTARPVAPNLIRHVQRARASWCIACILAGSATHASRMRITSIDPLLAPAFVLGAACLVALIGVGPLGLFWLRSETAEGARCRNCGYRLQGGADSTCPECGWRGDRAV